MDEFAKKNTLPKLIYLCSNKLVTLSKAYTCLFKAR